jgi:hypothetical protein
VSILSLFCRNNKANQRKFRKAGGVDALAEFVRRDLKVPQTKEPQLRLAVIDCLWSALLNNKRNILHFLLLDGVDLLLSVLTRCPKFMTKQVLGCLCDVLVQPAAHARLAEWSSAVTSSSFSSSSFSSTFSSSSAEPGESGLGLLLRLWVEEDAKHGKLTELVRQNKRSLENDDSPLHEEVKETVDDSSSSSEDEDEGLPTEKGMTLKGGVDKLQSTLVNFNSHVQEQDCRNTLYAILLQVGFSSFGNASQAQKAQLRIIERHVTLKKCLLMQDIVSTLDKDPVECDWKFLLHKLEHGQTQGSIVSVLNDRWGELQKEEELEHLEGFIKSVNERKQQQGINAVQRQRFLSLKSKRNHSLNKRARDDMLNKSLDKSATLKRTTPHLATRGVEGKSEASAKKKVQPTLSDVSELERPGDLNVSVQLQMQSKFDGDMEAQGFHNPSRQIGGDDDSDDDIDLIPGDMTDEQSYLDSVLQNEEIDEVMENLMA